MHYCKKIKLPDRTGISIEVDGDGNIDLIVDRYMGECYMSFELAEIEQIVKEAKAHRKAWNENK